MKAILSRVQQVESALSTWSLFYLLLAASKILYGQEYLLHLIRCLRQYKSSSKVKLAKWERFIVGNQIVNALLRWGNYHHSSRRSRPMRYRSPMSKSFTLGYPLRIFALTTMQRGPKSSMTRYCLRFGFVTKIVLIFIRDMLCATRGTHVRWECSLTMTIATMFSFFKSCPFSSVFIWRFVYT